MLVCKDFVVRLQCGRAVPAKVSLFQWYISRSMVSGRVSCQKHGIEKVCSANSLPPHSTTPFPKRQQQRKKKEIRNKTR